MNATVGEPTRLSTWDAEVLEARALKRKALAALRASAAETRARKSTFDAAAARFDELIDARPA